jgi:hypothetical protein
MKLLGKISVGLKLDSLPIEPCIACVQSQTQRVTFSTSDHIATRIGELVHSDECQIGIMSIRGYQYFVSFTDDYSRFTVSYLLKRKSVAFEAFKQFDARVFNITGRHICILRSDGGGELFNSDMNRYCKEHGIFQQKSQAYTPQQNCRAERINRWIVEGTSAMLLDTNLP